MKTLPLLVAGAAAALVLLTSCADNKPAPASPTPGATTPAAAPTPSRSAPLAVTTYVVVPSKLTEQVQATGELKANEEVDLRSEAAGRLVALHFREGEEVAAGTLLVKINDAEPKSS